MDDAIHKNEDRNVLRTDFYAATFVSYVFVDDRIEIQGVSNWENYRGKTIRESELSRSFMNCLFIFLMQTSLTWIIYYFMYVKNNGKLDEDDSEVAKDDPTMQYNPYILITRFVCALILHLQIEPEIC